MPVRKTNPTADRIQLDVLVEEWSAEIVVQKFFRPWLLRESGRQLTIETRRFNGKPDLFNNLPIVLSGYAKARRGGQDVRVAVYADASTYKTSDRFARTLAMAGVRETSKRVWAERISVQLDVSRNRSDSFRAFASGLLKLVSR